MKLMAKVISTFYLAASRLTGVQLTKSGPTVRLNHQIQSGKPRLSVARQIVSVLDALSYDATGLTDHEHST
ncbi:hypothetical protein BaRGS_00033897 [Batillaria attramentaria]|uniref:Uncharacterized protein n=1 Tax=Batillaria attramentaria TaxID=370345 RepID=A0ABD0JJB5_9CAEN